jgi:hypothetical protein
MMLEWWQVGLLVATGLLGGTLGGFLGIGGTIVFMPMLKIIWDAGAGPRLDPHTAIAATLVLNVCVGASATVGHLRSGRVMGGVIRVLIPSSVVASLGGVYVGNLFEGEAGQWLWRLFGLLMVYVVCVYLYHLVRPVSRVDSAPGDVAGPPPRWWAVGVIGVVVGFGSGLLGIGGGAIAVPAQQVFLRLGLRTAIANSAVTVIFACLLAAIIKQATLWAHGGRLATPWVIVGILAPPAIAGALVGSHLMHRVSRTWLRVVFIAFLAWTAYKMLTA